MWQTTEVEDGVITLMGSGGSFAITVQNDRTNKWCNVQLSRDQAADLLESLLSMGVQVNARAQATLDRV